MNSSTCQPQVRPYGSWKSPVTSDLIVAGTVGLAEVSIDGDKIYWIESRPSESGRSVLVRRSSDGRTTDVTPAGFNTRTTVHEYGGGSYIVADDVVYFSNFSDQQIYKCPVQQVDSMPEPLTNAKSMRYADGVIDRSRNRLISVREDHSNGTRDSVNTLVAIDLASGTSRIIVSGNDFYSTPRLSSDGKRLAWLTWNHPNLPWDG